MTLSDCEDHSGTVVQPISIPRNNDFDQRTAKYLLQNCACLIVENFPIGSEFGIDLSIHYTGENFMGIKMIPPGVHFIYYSLVKQGSVAPRIGLFHYFKAKEVLITKWDPLEEDIVLDRRDYDQMERLKCGFLTGNLDSKLGAYQFDKYQTWVTLTDFITEDLFYKLNPECKKIFSASNLVYKANSDGTVSNKLDQFGLPEMEMSPECVIRFLSTIPKHFLYPDGIDPKEITQHSLDSTYTLEQIIRDNHGNVQNSLLGELQFSFIAFLLGHVFEAFEFWLEQLRVISSARSALNTRPELFLYFIRVVHFQVKQTNEAIFADIVENENQVYRYLRTFILNIRSEADTISPELSRRGRQFHSFLTKTYKWCFDEEEEPEDEKPVVVML